MRECTDYNTRPSVFVSATTTTTMMRPRRPRAHKGDTPHARTLRTNNGLLHSDTRDARISSLAVHALYFRDTHVRAITSTIYYVQHTRRPRCEYTAQKASGNERTNEDDNNDDFVCQTLWGRACARIKTHRRSVHNARRRTTAQQHRTCV